VTHGTEVVDLRWLDARDDIDEVGGIAEISVVKKESDTGFVSVFVEVFDAAGVERRGTANDAVNLKVGEISE